jgi:hypothetical protein
MAKKKPNVKVSKKAKAKPKTAKKVAGSKKSTPKKKVAPAKKKVASKPAAKKKPSPAKKKTVPAKKKAKPAKKPVKAKKKAPAKSVKAKKSAPVKKAVKIVKKIAKLVKKEIPKVAGLIKKELPKSNQEKIVKEKPAKIDKKAAKKPAEYIPKPIAPIMDQTIAKNYTPPISRPSQNQPVFNRPLTPPTERKATPNDDKLLAIKKEVLNKCLEFQTSFINTAKKAMDEAQESANEEKGSNEEKFDSFRETMQIARDMHARQLAEGIDGLALLKRIAIAPLVDHVKLGSIVCTNLQNYFISASLGEIEQGGKSYMAISTMTPLYQALAGKQKGDKFSFRNTEYKILDVF